LAGTREIWVFSEKEELLAELIAGGHQLAEQYGSTVAALVLGDRSQVDEALAHGAQRVLWLGERKADYLVDDYVPTLMDAVEKLQPAVLLVGATRQGRAIAARIAARLDTTALTDVMEFLFDEGALQGRHMIFGGGAVQVDQPTGEVIIATAGQGTFTAHKGQPTGGEVEELAFIEPAVRARLVERKPRQVTAVNLGAARRVVCAGRGVSKQEDLPLVEELARALGAEMACTRPLAEGLDWLPRERYIGISGAIIKPDLYLGVGVSGQAQHAIGMHESRVVVAINKDSSAPIVTQADYWISEDLYTVIPALLEALRAKRT
jgi:electron transfer flavoprotein alpha subunit